MMTSTAWYHDSGQVEIRTPYNAQFVDDLKYEIPAAYREWNTAEKTWTVAPPYDHDALRILQRYFPFAEIGEPPRRPAQPSYAAPSCGCSDAHRALCVTADAPPAVVKAVYRVLAKVNHPDRGGDSQRMQEINAAFERLTSEVRS